MKNVLLLVHDDSGQEARFQAALDLCRALGGHLTCLDVAYVPPVMGSGYYDNAYAVAEIVKDQTARELVNRQKLEARLSHEDVPWEWIDACGDFARCLKRSSELADVIVVDRQLGNFAYPNMQGVASELVVRSGKPVLAVPSDCPRLALEAAMVAWDGSACAAVAMRAAVPLLRCTDEVVIIEVDDGSVTAPAEHAAQYLSRHDIRADVRRIKASSGGAGKVLLDEACGGAFSYAVLGGYGHLRLLESLFGGVTRTMLSRCPIPVFLAH
ncbi:MAG: universal stress protein [Sphingomonas sp.]